MDSLSQRYRKILDTIFAPSFYIANRLRFLPKIALFSVIISIPLIVTMYLLIHDINYWTDFVQKEIIGIKHNSYIRSLIKEVQQHRGLSSAYLSGNVSFKELLEEKTLEIKNKINNSSDHIETFYASHPHILRLWTKTKEKLTGLLNGIYDLSPQESFMRHTDIISDLLFLMIEIGHVSNLVLDPHAESYYLISSFLKSLPSLTEYIGQTRAIGTAATVKRALTIDDKSKLSVLSAQINASLANANRALQYGFTSALTHNVGLRDDYSDMINKVAAYNSLLDKQLINAKSLVLDTGHFFATATETKAKVYDVCDKLESALLDVLNKRLQGYKMKKNLAYGAATAIVVLLLYIVMGFYLFLSRTVTTLGIVAKNMADGTIAHTVNIEAKDELGDVVSAFNTVAIALHENYEQLKTLINSLPDFVYLKDSSGRWIEANDAALRLFSLIGKDYKGKKDNELIAEEVLFQGKFLFSEVHEQSIWQSKGPMRGEETFFEKDNKSYRTFDIIKAPLFHHNGTPKGIVVIGRDITEQQKVQRMKNEFIATVSHELRTPLTSIKGALGLLVGGVTGQLNEKAQSLLQIASKNTERLMMLINDILDMEKIESGRMTFNLTPVDIVPTLQQCIETLKPYAEQYNVAVKLIADFKYPLLVNADKNRLLQVTSNLLSNAIKFSPKDATVEVTVVESGDKVRVNVTDHGEGVPEDFRSKIFEKFAQADASDSKQKGGTGLGLSISKAIIEKMGGSIGYDSKPGVATTFFYILPKFSGSSYGIVDWIKPPIDEDRLKKTIISQTHTSLLSKKKARILHVEDDVDIVDLVSEILKDIAELDYANTIHDAQAKLQNADYDMVILDINLPDGNGLKLLPIENSKHQKISVIIFSVYDVLTSPEQDVSAVLVKANTTNQQLMQTVKDVFESNHPNRE